MTAKQHEKAYRVLCGWRRWSRQRQGELGTAKIEARNQALQAAGGTPPEGHDHKVVRSTAYEGDNFIDPALYDYCSVQNYLAHYPEDRKILKRFPGSGTYSNLLMIHKHYPTWERFALFVTRPTFYRSTNQHE